MDLFAALVALGRRWYLTLVLIVLVMGGTYGAAKSVKPDYKATASVIVLAPSQDPTKANSNLGSVNPLLGAGTPTFANALSRIMSSDTTTQQVVHLGGTTNYTVGQGTSTNAPVLNIEATDSSPSRASKTASILIALINREAEQLQAQQTSNPPKSSYITTQTITSGDRPSKLSGSRTRVMVAVGAMGVVFTFGTVLLFDSWLMSRRARRRRGRRGRRSDETKGNADDSTSDGQATPSQDIPLARVRP